MEMALSLLLDTTIFGSSKGSVRAEKVTYLQILGHSDGLCVVLLAQTQEDGSNRGCLGDMERTCGKG